MPSHTATKRLAFHLGVVFLLAGAWGRANAEQDVPSPDAKPSSLRGPLHEAYSQPVDGSDVPGVVIRKRPEGLLRDVPAAIKPSSASAIWIPGYWGWDEEAGDFIWVTGVWRIPPPGMRWVPGYWNQEGDDWRWVRGFWISRDQPRLRYLPSPPPPQEEPELAELDDDQFAVRGYWTYAGGRYVWNRGFKTRRKSGWQWVPSRYTWTPLGSIFVPGFWDYELSRRGLLFAPVRVAATDRSAKPSRSTAPLAPKEAIKPAALSEALVMKAAYGHYYVDSSLADSETTIAISELVRLRAVDLSLTEISAETLPRLAQGAESVRLLAIQRWQFESNAANQPARGLAFYLPPPAEPLNPPPATMAAGEAASEYVPGARGRRVPGASGRTVPGITGRVVPGVDTNLPGVIGPEATPGRR